MHYKLNTKLIHAGVAPDPSTGAIMTPIYQVSTFVQPSPGENKGYEYARAQNPTRDALQNSLAAIENGRYALCYSSGMAAADAVLKLLKPGDEVIVSNDIYWGNYRIMTKMFSAYGVIFHFVNMYDVEPIKEYINQSTKMIWIETPSNPLLNLIDIAAIAKVSEQHSLLLVCDNTFASPYLQNPLDYGANIVVHSASKYLGGHSDVILGAVIVNESVLYEKLQFIQYSCGAVPGPQDCWLVLRGIKTLHVRMQRHCENGKVIAHYLRSHPKVDQVLWVGFADHPNHKIARKQMRDFGGMISFTLKNDILEEAVKVVKSTKLFSLAESLGGVESLICHPATMMHASTSREDRLKYGLPDSLIRLSVGIEDVSDLIVDLKNALERNL